MTKQTRRVFLKQAAGAAAACAVLPRFARADVNSQIRMAVDRLQWPRQEPHRWLQGSTRRAVRLRSSRCWASAAEEVREEQRPQARSGRRLPPAARSQRHRRDFDRHAESHALADRHSGGAGRQGRVLREAGQPLRVGRPAAGRTRRSSTSASFNAARRPARISAIQEAVEYVRSGKLGKIQYVIGTCYKPRPEHRQARSAARRFRSTSTTTCGAARRRRSICIGRKPALRLALGLQHRQRRHGQPGHPPDGHRPLVPRRERRFRRAS